jgi:flavin-dependent dehydrogenase
MSGNITKLQFSSLKGKTINCHLPLGGFGISRYALDEFLYQKAISNGCEIIQETVENIVFHENESSLINFSANLINVSFSKSFGLK